MKHLECPIRQAAVTHVAGADAGGAARGPVRRTAAEARHSHRLLQEGLFAHRKRPPPLNCVVHVVVALMSNILIEIQHLKPPVWENSRMGEHQNNRIIYQIFYVKVFIFFCATLR